MLRQQEVIADGRPNRSLADFIAPKESLVPDYLGLFAVTAGLGADELAKQFERSLDDYNAIMVKALADRLAEAFAEYLHAQARKDWGYGARRSSPPRTWSPKSTAASAPPTATRLARTTARSSSCSTSSTRARSGINLTESGAMTPAASVSGLYFSHPEAKYFNVGRIGRDQLEDYARRKGEALEVTERWLSSQLAYEPAEFSVKC